jgi:hypothetical protein
MIVCSKCRGMNVSEAPAKPMKIGHQYREMHEYTCNQCHMVWKQAGDVKTKEWFLSFIKPIININAKSRR